MADGDFTVKAIISAQTSQFEKGMKDAQKSLNEVSKSIQDVSNLLKSAFSVAGIALSVKAVTDFGSSCVKAADEANKSFSILNNTINVTGATAWTSAEKMEQMSVEISDATNYSVGEIQDMQSVLLGFRNITGETFREASDAITDMATVMGMDLKSAVQTVGKALDDPIKGLDSLKRQGFAFTEEQKEELAMLVKTGKQMEAQKIILDELNTTYGGAAKAAQSATARWNHAMDSFKESIGNQLMPAVNASTEQMTKVLKKITEFVNSSEFNQIIVVLTNIANKVKEVFVVIGNYISEVFTEIMEIFNKVDFSPFKSVLDTLLGSIIRIVNVIRERIDEGIQRFKAVAGEIGGIVSSLDLEGISEYINAFIDGFWFIYDEVQKVTQEIQDWITEKIIWIWEKIKELFNNSTDALASSESSIKSWGNFFWEILDNVFRIFQDLINSVKAILHGDWAVVWEYAKLTLARWADNVLTLFSTVANAFPQLINGIIDGLNKVIEQVNKVREFFGDDPIGLVDAFSSVDLSEKSGLNKFISDTEKKIEELTGKVADISIKNLKGISTESKGTFDKLKSEITATGNVSIITSNRSHKTYVSNLNSSSDSSNEFFNQLKKGWQDLKEEIEKDSKDWGDVIKTSYTSITNVTNNMFVMMGENLAGASNGYQEFSATAVEGISEILKALAAQITALGVTHALTLDFAGAALAAAGAAAALAAAGALVAVAKNMKATKDATDSCNESLKEFKKRLDEIWSGKKSGSGIAQAMLDVDASIVQLNKDLAEANRKIKETAAAYKKLGDEHGTPLNNGDYRFDNNLVYLFEAFKLSKENKKAWDEYNETLKKIDAANAAYESKLREINEGIEEQIEGTKALVREQVNMYSTLSGFRDAYRPDEIWTGYSKYISNQLTANVQSLLDGVYDSFVTFGRGIGEKLMDSISEGATQSDFMESMRSYIRETMLKLAVYTEEFQEKLADAGRKMINSVMNGGGGLNAVADELARLYDSAAKAAETVDAALEKAFGKYRAVGEAAEETAETEEEIAVSIADQTDLLAEFADKLQEIKSKASAVKSEFDSMHKNATASIKGYAENYEEMIKSARQLMELKKEAASTLYQKYNATISPYNAAYVNYSAEQSRMNLAAQAVAEQKQKVAELEEKLKKVETLTTFGGIIERSIFSYTLDTAKINLADLEKKAASAEAAFNSAKNQWEESRAAYNSALEEYRSALAESKEAAAAYKSAMNNTFMELKLNIKETNAALDTQIDLLKKLQADMNIMADTIRINVKESYKSILGSLEETGTAIGDRLASSIAGGAQKSDFMLEMKEYVRQTAVKLAVYTESMQGRLANAGAKLAQGIMSGSSATIKLAQNMISSLYNDTSKIADKALAAVDDAFNGWNKTVKETNKTAKETASSASKTVKTLAELKAELRSLYKEFAFSGLIARGNLKSAVSAQLEKIESTVRSYYEGFASLGNDLGASLINGFKGGLSKSDMRLEVKDWIRTQVLQKTVYGTYGKQLAEIGAEVGSYLANGGSAALKAISSDIGSLYGKITAAMSGVDAALDSAFGKKLEESAGNVSTAAKETTKFADVVKNLKDTLADLGGDIAGKLTEGLKGGLSKNDMLATMKEYIKDMVIQSVVYTDSMKSRIESIGRSVANLITGSKTKGAVSSVKSSIGSLYDELAKKSESALKMIDEVFPEMSKTVEETTENTEKSLSKLESAIESFKEAVSDLGGDIAGELVSGLTEGLSQGDFLKNMKDWIRKTLVQSVVYTESLKGEIEAIGKTISSAVKGGMTETTMHEIRRDLSFIFEKASASMNSIDSVLSGVFDGYASGTTSALSGLHIVGEAGPELVRFKGGERVYNNADTMKMIAGAGKTNNMNITFNNLKDTSAFAMMSQLKQYNRELAINGIL